MPFRCCFSDSILWVVVADVHARGLRPKGLLRNNGLPTPHSQARTPWPPQLNDDVIRGHT